MQFTFTFEGTLAADPELRITQDGRSVCKLRVAHNTRRRNTAGEWVNGPTMWVSVTAWGVLAERAAELSQGDTVTVDARDDLSIWAYTNQENQAPAGQLQVTAANISVSLRFKAARSVTVDKPVTDGEDPWASVDAAAAVARELQPTA